MVEYNEYFEALSAEKKAKYKARGAIPSSATDEALIAQGWARTEEYRTGGEMAAWEAKWKPGWKPPGEEAPPAPIEAVPGPETTVLPPFPDADVGPEYEPEPERTTSRHKTSRHSTQSILGSEGVFSLSNVKRWLGEASANIQEREGGGRREEAPRGSGVRGWLASASANISMMDPLGGMGAGGPPMGMELPFQGDLGAGIPATFNMDPFNIGVMGVGVPGMMNADPFGFLGGGGPSREPARGHHKKKGKKKAKTRKSSSQGKNIHIHIGSGRRGKRKRGRR